MPILGLVTKSEYTKLTQELDALKRNMFAPFERWQLETAAAEKYTLPDPSIYENQADLYRKLSWVLQAVEITATAAALTPFGVARVISGKEPKDIPNHDLEKLLSHPNPLDSRFEFLQATIALYMLNGNAYWWMNCKDEYSPPDEIWFIPPHKIMPVPDENLFLKGYLYSPGNGSEIFIPPHEIVHFKRFNPFSRFLGMSAIESLAIIAGGDIAMQMWNTKYFGENNARVPSILTFEQMIADPTWEKIKADTREAARKREMLMLRGTGEGVSWMQNSISQKEMEFLSGREFNKQEIQNTLAPGLSTWLSETSTLANSESNRAAFNELSVYPKHVIMAEKITASILSRYGGRELICSFEDVRVSDRLMQLREQREYAKTHTINKINEKYYQADEIFEDERGDLIPIQLKATPAEPDAEDEGDMEQPDEMDNEEDGQEEQADKRENGTYKALEQYERYALRKIGKPLEFVNDVLPQATIKAIADELKDRDAVGIRQVFKRHKAKHLPTADPNEAAAVLEGIRLALKAMEK